VSLARHPLWQLTLARLRELGREPGTMFWVFGFPVLLSIALGLAFRDSGAEPVVVGVVEPAPDALVERLSRAGIRVQRLPAALARERLRGGRVSLLIITPAAASPAAPAGGAIHYRFDPVRPEARLARAAVDQALQRAAGRRDPVVVEDEVVTERGSRYIDFLVPGLIGMNVMSGSMWAVGWVIVNLRVRKLMKRLLATPVRRRDILISLALSRLIVLPFEAGSLLIFARLVFGVGVAGSLGALAVLTVLGSLSFSGLAICIASRAQNSETVTGLMNAVMLPMFILSGVFFSSARFPDLMQPAIALLPLTALNQALRAVMLDGATLLGVGRSCLVLAGWGAAGYLVGLRIFRWS
jgi:ABC-2 type transport system permease protein